ncbi:imidazoleglycerol-phosphate dehydratase [Rhodobacteraceae bacterium EhC02]|nr:imidazoleglycerol-phosphate dehydratase [Rhodobacteraceae bacterium EhC02]
MTRMMMTALILMATAGAGLAEPLLGAWRTAPQDDGTMGVVQVAPCGVALCGTLIASLDSAGKEVPNPENGMTILSETVAFGGGEYRGKIYAPDRDQTYNSRLQLSGDTLKVSGCVLGICRDGGSWTRVK